MTLSQRDDLQDTCAGYESEMAQTGVDSFEPRALLAVGACVALAKWAFASDRRIFHVYFDEPAQFAMARWLSGRQSWTLFDLDTWQPGYALLIAPIYFVTDDVATVFRAVMVLNAVMGGVSAILLVFLTRRLTDVSRAACCGLATAISLLPMSLSASAVAWGEPLITLLFLAALLSMLRYLDNDDFRAGLLSLALAATAALTHGRMLPLVFVVAAIVIAREARAGSVRQWRPWLTAGILAASLVLTFSFSAFVRERVWETPGGENSIHSTLSRLADPTLVASSFLGQLWYQLVASALIFGIGTAVLVRRIVGPLASPLLIGRGRDALAVLAMTAPLLAVSVLFMARAGRPDFAIYGRYNDAVVGPILVVGLAWLWRVPACPPRRVVAMIGGCLAVTVATTLYVESRSGDALGADLGLAPMVAGMLPFTDRGQSLSPILGAAVSIVVCSVLLGSRLLTMPRSEVVFGAVVTVLVFSAGGLTYSALRPVNEYETASAVRVVRGIVPPDTAIGYHFVSRDEPSYVSMNAQRRAALLYQAYLPDYEIVRDAGLDDGVGPFVFAPRLDPTLTEAGAVELWVAQDSGMALWREPVSP
ncbi:MAG: glycosyltransferase family 39 protein [Ilumatobacteraceae bacterium]|nr:glycosyltransferase family 39 protein [Ilumatobacteraceae bacterium]